MRIDLGAIPRFVKSKRRYRFAHGYRPADRTAIINHLVARRGARRYLEIGSRDGKNFDRILAPERISVDPDPAAVATFYMTSDAFFAQDVVGGFDVVLVDGLHLDAQVRRDIDNCLSHLNPGGVIVVHDCNPPTEFHQRQTYEVNGKFPAWNGTVWKAWVYLRATREDLSMHVVDTDWGVGIVERGSQIRLADPGYDFAYLKEHRREALNLISVEDFLARY